MSVEGAIYVKIEEIIISMEKRPGMYVPSERLDYICCTIGGYCLGRRCSSKTDETDMEQMFDLWFWKWMMRRIETTLGSEYLPDEIPWYYHVQVLAGGGDAVKAFYQLSKEFFADYHARKDDLSWKKELFFSKVELL